MKDESWSISILAGSPTSQPSLDGPWARRTAVWPSTTCMLMALLNMHTKTMAQDLKDNAGLFLVCTSLPDTNVDRGPNRSALTTQKKGAMV